MLSDIQIQKNEQNANENLETQKQNLSAWKKSNMEIKYLRFEKKKRENVSFRKRYIHADNVHIRNPENVLYRFPWLNASE